MELLERYLQAVRKYLPARRQDDIIAELRANLESQLEEREAELGRPLTEAEAAEWLKGIGPPTQMAARYQPAQYLIGPGVFPVYLHILRLALAWAFVVFGIVSVIQIVGQTPSAGAVGAALLRLPWILMITAAWVTLAFAVIEFAAAHNSAWCPEFAASGPGWSPASLPPLQRTDPDGHAVRSRAHAIAEVAFGVLLLIWMLLIPAHPFLVLGPGARIVAGLPYQLGPVWWQFYWWIVALNVVQLVWHAFDLARGKWQRPPAAQHIVFKAMGLVPLILMLRAPAGSLVLPKQPGDVSHQAALAIINHNFHAVLLVIAVIAGAQLLWDLGKLGMEAYRKRAANRL